MKKRRDRLKKSLASALLIWILWSQDYQLAPPDLEIKNKLFEPHDTFDTKTDCVRTGEQQAQKLAQTWRSTSYGRGRVIFSEDGLGVSLLIDKFLLGTRYFCFPSNFDPRGPKG